MKITDIKSYVYAPLPETPWFFIEIETDEGMTGLGETSDYRATQMLAGGIDAIKHLLIGEDPSHTAHRLVMSDSCANAIPTSSRKCSIW